MKKTVLFISALLIVSAMQAQFHFGPQIGYTATNLTLNVDDISTSMGSNFMFGAFVRIGEKIPPW